MVPDPMWSSRREDRGSSSICQAGLPDEISCGNGGGLEFSVQAAFRALPERERDAPAICRLEDPLRLRLRLQGSIKRELTPPTLLVSKTGYLPVTPDRRGAPTGEFSEPLALARLGLGALRNLLKRPRTVGNFPQVDGPPEGLSAFGHGHAGRVFQKGIIRLA